MRGSSRLKGPPTRSGLLVAYNGEVTSTPYTSCCFELLMMMLVIMMMMMMKLVKMITTGVCRQARQLPGGSRWAAGVQLHTARGHGEEEEENDDDHDEGEGEENNAVLGDDGGDDRMWSDEKELGADTMSSRFTWRKVHPAEADICFSYVILQDCDDEDDNTAMWRYWKRSRMKSSSSSSSS